MTLTLAGSAVLAGCGQGMDNNNYGQLSVALALPGGVTVNSVAWRVLSSTNAVLASGTTNTSNPSSTPSVNVSIPPGTGDTVVMTATTSDSVACTGTSAPFNVTAGQSSAVAVNVLCGTNDSTPNLGSVVVSGVLVAGDNCPVLTSWVLSPQQTAANGGTIDVAVTATDADTGETLAYAWTATSGSFVSASSASTQFTCGPAGQPTLSVAVSDNHSPTPCSVNVAFPPVTCQ
jgi:hypothetical protein